MLQIMISRYSDDTVVVQDIVNTKNNEVLATFDKKAGKIDFDVLEPYIGEKVKILYHYKDQSEQEDYLKEATLEKIGVDPETNLKYISFR